MFLRDGPHWLSNEERQQVAGLIAVHDVFGRLARGITERPNPMDLDEEPLYRGALSPAAVREALALHQVPVGLACDLWEADVAAVATLRWLLPLLPTLVEMIEET